MKQLLAILVGVLLAALVVVGVVYYWREPAPPPMHITREPVDEAPPEVVQSPYRNAQPGVKYVGDAACADCHVQETRSYMKHPMSRSLAPVADLLDRERVDAKAHNPFKAIGFKMRVERRGKQLVHVEAYEDERGQILAELSAPVEYVIGSGAQGRTYLINREGRLYQSSISWFSGEKRWGLAPGYAMHMEHFYRPIEPVCLFCHANRAAVVLDSVNRYQSPIFRGHAIGCERCHGPGDLHVKEGGGNGDSIINPRRLEYELREAVCQQCHLQGEARILRRGRGEFDYRPGLPLQAFWSVFVRPPELTDGRKSVGQVEQMHLSRCFRESKGKQKLGCISCHDPHDYPAEENKAAYYRDRCLRCHQENSCSLTPDARRAVDSQDSCFGCHMPKASSSNIVHAATTDHRIVRSSDRPPRPQPAARGGLAPLIDFHREHAGQGEPVDPRDLGMAIAMIAGQSRGRDQVEIAAAAARLLKEAVAKAPSDLPAGESLGYTLWLQGRYREAKAAFDAVLERSPNREETLTWAARNEADLGQDDTAIALWKRLLHLNPWHPQAHYRLALLLAKKEQWQAAIDESAAALRVNPFHLETRKQLVLYHVKNGQADRARAEFKTLLAMNPPDPAALRRWFDDLTR